MPTYEYQCKSCEHRFEIWQKMADEPLTTCPQCQGVIRRVLFPAGIVFKGSGFYKTDHRNGKAVDDNNQNGHEANSAGDSKDGTTKAESKGEGAASSENPKKASSEHGKEKASSKSNENKATVEAD